jgi:hypothetical protein
MLVPCSVRRTLGSGEEWFNSVCKPLQQAEHERGLWRRCGGFPLLARAHGAGVGRQAALSVERDDDLAVGEALLDVRQRLGGLVERERLVDDRAEVAGVVQGGQFA